MQDFKVLFWNTNNKSPGCDTGGEPCLFQLKKYIIKVKLQIAALKIIDCQRNRTILVGEVISNPFHSKELLIIGAIK
jgi:hypothetical protein